MIESAHSEVGGAALDVERHVGILEQYEACSSAAGRNDEPPRLRDVLLGLEACPREPVERRS